MYSCLQARTVVCVCMCLHADPFYKKLMTIDKTKKDV